MLAHDGGLSLFDGSQCRARAQKWADQLAAMDDGLRRGGCEGRLSGMSDSVDTCDMSGMSGSVDTCDMSGMSGSVDMSGMI